MTRNKTVHDLARLALSPAGWRPSGYEAGFRSQNLFEYLNGGAERYLGYGFEELFVREFTREDNQEARILVEIYRMDSTENAFGIFSSDRAGDLPRGIGLDAALGDHLLQFWQNRYFVRVQDSGLSGSLRESLVEFGKLISAGMPAGAETDRPAILSLLPVKDRIGASVCYFHTQNSLNSLIYLGEENLLGLGPEVQALNAEYHPDANAGIVRVLLIAFPAESACRESFYRLSHARPNLPERARQELSHLSINGSYLLALFGQAGSAWTTRLETGIWNKLKR